MSFWTLDNEDNARAAGDFNFNGQATGMGLADFLIGQGARMDIFIAAMLGHIDFVKAALAAYPSLLESKGPHGITLMAHAERRGAENAEMVKFLKSLKS